MRKVAHIFHTECLSRDRYWDQLRKWYPGMNGGPHLVILDLTRGGRALLVSFLRRHSFF
jgi:hypothetical protein